MSDFPPVLSGRTGRHAAAVFLASVFTIGALTLSMAGAAAPGSAPPEDDRTREAARDPLGFEECAKRALRSSSDVRAVYRECEAAANAFVARQEFSDPSSVRRGMTPPDAQARIADLEHSPHFLERRDLAQAFEVCAENSYSQDESVQTAFRRCDGELQEYLATFSETERSIVELHVRAATHHALTERSIETATQREGES